MRSTVAADGGATAVTDDQSIGYRRDEICAKVSTLDFYTTLL